MLLPMVALYERSRREVVQARLEALVQAGSSRVQLTLREVRANTGVITTVPAMADLLAAAPPPPQVRQRVEAVFRAQLREYERLRALAVFDAQGQPLAQLSRDGAPPPPAPQGQALERAANLASGQFWLSPLLRPAQGPPELLLSRPLFSPAGERRGTLLAVVSLLPLARDFDRITNGAPAFQRGYLLGADGRTLSATPGAYPGLDFAARYPQVWRQIQRQPRGVVDTDRGLFLFEAGGRDQPLAVVIQVPSGSLTRSSAFAQPAGLALLAMLYGLAAGSSVVIAAHRSHLARLREQDRRLRERLQAVQRSAGVGLCLCDPLTARFQTVNEALCSFFGRSEEDLLHRTWQELTHPDDLEDDRKLALELQRGDRDHYRLRKRYLRPDGATIWGDLVVSCTRNPDGTIHDLIGQISDATELLAKSAYLEAASSAGVVGVWDWDIPRDVLTWDAVMHLLYGLRAEDFRGTREAWEQAVHPDDRAYVLQETQAALHGLREFQPRFRVVWPDGSIHHVQARSRTSFQSDGTPLRMIGVNYDITEMVERELELERQRRMLATTLDALVDPLLLLRIEQPGGGRAHLRIDELNPAATAFFGRPRVQLLGQPLALVLPEGCNASLHRNLMAVAQGGPSWLADDIPAVLQRPGEPRALDLRAVLASQGLVLSFRDVTERHQALRNLTASEERFRLLAENASDVVFRAGLTGVTEWITGSVTPLIGWAPADLEGQPFADFVHPDDLALLADVRGSFKRGERRQFRLRVRRRDGGYHWVGVNARGVQDGHGAVVGLVGSWGDAQREVESERELEHRARTDPLTGLYNRQEIFEQLEHLALHRRQSDGGVAVLFCDIDHFKAINDRYGHGVGDIVLQALGQRMLQHTRSGDLVGRIGGDELLVVLPAMPSLAAAMAIAAKIHGAAHEPLPLPNGELVPTLSIGVALIQAQETIDALVARADQAMYEAKSSGRDRVIAIAAR